MENTGKFKPVAGVKCQPLGTPKHTQNLRKKEGAQRIDEKSAVTGAFFNRAEPGWQNYVGDRGGSLRRIGVV